MALPASEPQVVASLHADGAARRRLWKAAIKWPMYAVAVMPVLLAAGWRWGQGEPLCWLAFGPLATAAGLLALAPAGASATVPWRTAVELGGGPALATTLVLFCSHFHQVEEDAAHGKRSPVVRLGTARAAALVPWFVAGALAFQWAPVLAGHWPLTALLGAVGLPPAQRLIRLLRDHHHLPERIAGSKFLALRFQALNGLGLALGLALGARLG
jgi:1,4-dihydroxy-2-naphthoate octaprenyltransferase